MNDKYIRVFISMVNGDSCEASLNIYGELDLSEFLIRTKNNKWLNVTNVTFSRNQNFISSDFVTINKKNIQWISPGECVNNEG